MADVWSRLGIKPYEADPKKVKLQLDEMKPPPPLVRTPRTLPQDTVFSQDGFIPDALRTMGDTGLNYMNLGAAGINALGGEIDRTLLTDAIAAVRSEQEKSDGRTLSPIRKAETDKIKAQMAAANGVVENIAAGSEAGLDMLLHPIENSGKIVGGLVDPTNFVPGLAGAKIAAKIGGGLIGRIGSGAVAGAVSNAPLNAVEEGVFSAARGEDWKKNSAAGFGGGAVGGAMIGGVAGGLSKGTPAAAYSQDEFNAFVSERMNQWSKKQGEQIVPSSGDPINTDIPSIRYTQSISHNPLDSGVDDPALLTYESQKQLPYNEQKLIEHSDTIIQGLHGWSEPLGNRIQEAIDSDTGNTINDKINGIIDAEVTSRAADHVTQWADSRELAVRDENDQAQLQIHDMLSNGMDAKSAANALDNIITPTREDVKISGLLNNNNPLPSRLSGVRPILLLENSIKTAVENPAIARTNKEFYDVLVAQGVDKPYANIITSAYAAKDPSILRDHIYETLIGNSPALIDHEAIKGEVSARVDGMIKAKDAVQKQAEFTPGDQYMLDGKLVTINRSQRPGSMIAVTHVRGKSISHVFPEALTKYDPEAEAAKAAATPQVHPFGSMFGNNEVVKKVNEPYSEDDITRMAENASRDKKNYDNIVEDITRKKPFELDRFHKALEDLQAKHDTRVTKKHNIEINRIELDAAQRAIDTFTYRNRKLGLEKAKTDIGDEFDDRAWANVALANLESGDKVRIGEEIYTVNTVGANQIKISGGSRAGIYKYGSKKYEDLRRDIGGEFLREIHSGNKIPYKTTPRGVKVPDFTGWGQVLLRDPAAKKADQGGYSLSDDNAMTPLIEKRDTLLNDSKTLSKDSESVSKQPKDPKKKGITLETALRRIPSIEEAIRGTLENMERIKNSDAPDDVKQYQIEAHEQQIITSKKNLEEAKQVVADSKTLSNDSEKLSEVDGWKFVGTRGIGNTDHPSQFATYATVRDINGNEKMIPIAEFERGDLTNLQDIAERVPFPKINKIKTLSPQAQALKDASEIPVGGSEDATKRAAQTVFTPQLDAEYKKMSASDRAQLDQNYANTPEDLYGKAIATTNEVYGNDAGSANMALIDARAKAMGITSDAFMQQHGITIDNLTKEDGVQHIKDLEEANAAFQLSEKVINGMVEMGFKSTGEMKNSIKLFSTADVSTLPHELMHVFERTLDKDLKEAFDYAFRDYEVGSDRSEAAAQGFETWLSEGKAPTKELEAVFAKFQTWLRDMWEMVFHTPENGFKLNDSQRSFYRAMMGDKEAIKEVFGEIDAAPIEKDMIAAKILDEMPEATTVTKGENTQGGLFGANDGIIEQPKLFSDKVEVDTLKVPDGIKATPQEYRTTIREMAKGESLSHPMVAEQIKRSKSYVEAKEEETIKTGGVSLFGEPELEVPKVLEDVGAKIGGARKDNWVSRGLTINDLEAMSGGEQAKYATKENVLGKPDYAKMMEDNTPADRIALYKIIRDRMAAKPGKDTPEARRDYVEALNVSRDVFNEYLSGTIEAKEIDRSILDRLGYKPTRESYKDMDSVQKHARDMYWSLFKGRTTPFSVMGGDVRKAAGMLDQGFPSIEPYRRFYSAVRVRAEDKRIVTGLAHNVQGYRRAIRDSEGKVLEFATEADAYVHAKKLYEEGKKNNTTEKALQPKRPHIDYVTRTGEDIRQGKDVGADDFMKQYGFRGVEFGNWAAKDERQKIINHAYDALYDLARVLNIPDKAISLNGTLGMAFGSRGKPGAMAHYEPGKIVINMTKINGAGALAHEWGHAFDHYIGELDRESAYSGHANNATGGDKIGMVNRTNLREPLGQAFSNVMNAMFRTDTNRAEVIRKYALEIEKDRAAGIDTKAKEDRLVYLKKMDVQPGEGKQSQYLIDSRALGGKQWETPVEMFARAFEGYVYDKLSADFKRSDYLVQGVDEALFSEGFDGNPYPAGMERVWIDASFDALFKTIKQESMNDGNIRLFQTKKITDGLTKLLEDC